MRIKEVLIVQHNVSSRDVNKIKNIINKNKVKTLLIEKCKLGAYCYKNKDLIISLGGDGTLIRAAHFVEQQPILGVNSDPKQKEGFFLKANTHNFEKRFGLILKNKHKIIKLLRIKAVINTTKKTLPALNEVYVGSEKPYLVFRCEIFIKNKREKQKNSGVIVATPAGSHAWAKSAGAKTLPIKSNKIVFIIRDPYSGKLTKPKIKKGVADFDKIKIKALSKGVVVADSFEKEHKIRVNDIITFKKYKHPLNLVTF